MSTKFAFVGFRHGHILGLYHTVKNHPECELVAACEEDQEAAGDLIANVNVTHDNFEKMLAEIDCDVVAVGDYFAKRGSIIIKALEAGKHVISDKPICTSIEELDKIEVLAKANNLKIGCLLDIRDSALGQTMYKKIRSGKLGKIQAISFGGQHPLLHGTRAQWYFEPNKFGGVINDIGVHAVDIIEWVTDQKIIEVNAARCWNSKLPQYPHFKECGQMMLTMDNGCGILGDVSYLAPDSQGYKTPYYWRFTFWGEHGIMEISWNSTSIHLSMDEDSETTEEALQPPRPNGCFESFMNDLQGQADALSTQEILAASRKTLQIQKIADTFNEHSSSLIHQNPH
jgi:predicted dehydrogenase